MNKTIKKEYKWTPIARPERNKKIAELYKKGHYSYRAIGKMYNLSGSRIKEIIDSQSVRT